MRWRYARLSLARVWETLPKGIQSELVGLSAVHDMGDFRNNFAVGEKASSKLVQAHQRFGSAIHPVVKTHPVSGRKFLYINEGFTQHLVGMRATDSNKMLDYLYHHMNQPENQVRFQWSSGSIAIWDNRCTWHYATADYLPEHREMHRITLINDARAETNDKS
ncbi:MAG: taurine dioxygenase [Parasphingorhabdus sp.]|jgi:taurine dioxygenase